MVIPNGYKLTEIGVIPNEWDVVDLISLSLNGLQNGVFYEVNRKGYGIKLINVGDLYKKSPIEPTSLELFNANKNELDRFKVKKGDLFFTRSSIVPSGIAYCNWFESNETAVFDSHVIKFSTNTTLVNPMFLYSQCISYNARKYFISNAKTATMTTIDQNILGLFRLPLPPLDEKKKIAEALSDTDSLISSLEKLIEKKKRLNKVLCKNCLPVKNALMGFMGSGWSEGLESLLIFVQAIKIMSKKAMMVNILSLLGHKQLKE